MKPQPTAIDVANRLPLLSSLTVDQDVHLHRVVRRRRSASAAANAAFTGVIAGVADVGLGDKEARHLMSVMRPNESQ